MEPRTRTADDSLLAEGLTLEILDRLGGIERLDVRSRFVSRHIAGAADPIAMARSVGVDFILDGVVDIDTARVLVRGTLTRTATGRIVHTVRVQQPRSELARLEADLGREVAAAVVGQLAPSERAHFAAHQVDPVALDLLLRARALNGQYTEDGFRQGARLLEQAVARDSTFTEAWVELSVSYGRLKDFLVQPDPAFADRSDAAARRAMLLDSTSGAALVAVAVHRAVRNDVGPEVEAMTRRGVGRDHSTSTLLMAAYTLICRDATDDALALIRLAVSRDSLSPFVWAAAGFRLGNARRYTEASQAFERALALRPSHKDSVSLVAYRRHSLLERHECGALADTARQAHEDLLLIRSLHCLGHTAEADSIAAARLRDTTVVGVDRAAYLAWAGQPDSAFGILDRLYPRDLAITLQRAAFDAYHQHPAYLALRHRLGLDR